MGIRFYGRSYGFWLAVTLLAVVLLGAVLWIVALLFFPPGVQVAGSDCARFDNFPPMVLCGQDSLLPYWVQTVINWPSLNLGALRLALQGDWTGLRELVASAVVLLVAAAVLRLIFAARPEIRASSGPRGWTTESLFANVVVALLLVGLLLAAIGFLGNYLFPRGGGGMFAPWCERRGFLFPMVECTSAVPFGFLIKLVFALPLVIILSLLLLPKLRLVNLVVVAVFVLVVLGVALLMRRRARRNLARLRALPGDGPPPGDGDAA